MRRLSIQAEERSRQADPSATRRSAKKGLPLTVDRRAFAAAVRQ